MTRPTKISAFLVLIISFAFFGPQTHAQTNPNAIVEDSVRFYFADIPIMIDIARCETGFRQYNPDGTALHDASGTYVGVFQVSELLHTPRASSLGFDLKTIDGNMQYARYLYNSSGTNPWKGCLPAAQASLPANVPVTPVAPITPTPDPVTPIAVPTPGAVTVNLRIGVTNPQVLTVQQLLNRNGFVIALSGVGSAGNETNYFGQLTREALRKFQCAKINVCSGDEATTGYGRVGPATRSALNQL